MNMMVQMMDLDEFVELQNEFGKFDTDKDGIVSYRAFKRQLCTENTQIQEENLEKVFDRIDLVGNKKITFTNFLVATIDKSHFFSKQSIGSVFKKLDRKCKEFITINDISREFKDVCKTLSADEMDNISKFDFQGKSKMNFKEFEDFMISF
jgi:hypothetical protein